MARHIVTLGEGRGPDNEPCTIECEIENGLLTGISVIHLARSKSYFFRLYDNRNFTGEVLSAIDITKGQRNERE